MALTTLVSQFYLYILGSILMNQEMEMDSILNTQQLSYELMNLCEPQRMGGVGVHNSKDGRSLTHRNHFLVSVLSCHPMYVCMYVCMFIYEKIPSKNRFWPFWVCADNNTQERLFVRLDRQMA